MNTPAADIDLIREIYENQPEAAVWVKPVWDSTPDSQESKIVDFRFYYCNLKSEKLSGNPRDQMIGKCILEDRLPDPDPDACQLIFDQCLQVFCSGNILEYSYFSTALGKYLS